MPLICAMLWWEILDRAEITWNKQTDKLSHETINYIFTAVFNIYLDCLQLNCKINPHSVLNESSLASPTQAKRIIQTIQND